MVLVRLGLFQRAEKVKERDILDIKEIQFFVEAGEQSPQSQDNNREEDYEEGFSQWCYGWTPYTQSYGVTRSTARFDCEQRGVFFFHPPTFEIGEVWEYLSRARWPTALAQ